MTTAAIAAPAVEPAESFCPMLIGSFAIYEMPDGGFTIAWKRKGDPTSRQLPVPAALIAMAAAQTGKTRTEILAELTGSPV
jgi:hypothetical protein